MNNLELLYKIETTLYKIKISLSQKIFSNFSATQTVRKETASFQCRILCLQTLQRTQAIPFFFYSFQNAAHAVSTTDADNSSNQSKLITIHVAEAARENACQQGEIDLVVASDWLEKRKQF